MKEQIDTIPVNEAFETEDECPFCYLERLTEQKGIRYVIGPGASYMEPDVREVTDKLGFCGNHMKMLYDYGNSLGNALIMQTYFVGLLKDLQRQAESFTVPEKRGLFQKKEQKENPLATWAQQRTGSCYLCQKRDYNMRRYYHTFFYLLKEPEFRAKVENSKGFCLRHFGEMMALSDEKLPNGQQAWFYGTVLKLMQENLARVQGDLDWFIEKFDYRNASAPWKNSRDAVSRGMQKLRGIYPADAPYKEK
jgi:hypothetical protein